MTDGVTDSLAEAMATLSPGKLAIIEAAVSGGTPLERFERHTGVRTFEHVREWVGMVSREIDHMQRPREEGSEIPDLEVYLVGKRSEMDNLLSALESLPADGELDALVAWAMPRLRDILVRRVLRETPNGPPQDEAEDYLVGRQAVLSPLLANLRQVAESTARQKATISPGPR
jgi:hypothetical protein